MKHITLTGLVAMSATALATVGFAQDQQEEQQDRQLQQQPPNQTQQTLPQTQSQEDPRTQPQVQPDQRDQMERQTQQQGQQDQPQAERRGQPAEQTQQGQQAQQDQQTQQDRQAQQRQRAQQDQPLADYEPGAAAILSGTVASIGDEQFKLDYGQQEEITVELDEWDWSGQLDERLSEGQQVTVSGTIDENWTERRAIDADNIYVTTDYTYYYIVDENPAYTAQQSQRETQQDGTFLSTRGEVKDVSEDQITLESQGNTIQVDTSELAYDPLDEEGVQQIKEGDRIYVFGDIDEEFFENRTMSAESLISLRQEGQGRMDQGGQQGIQEPGQQSPQQQEQQIQEPGQQQGAQPQTQQQGN